MIRPTQIPSKDVFFPLILGHSEMFSTYSVTNVYSIVAVHGLGSSVETTWQHRYSGRLWLKDDLPLDLPKSRIMTYQHHSRWMSHAQAKNLSDFGKQLLSALDGVRKSNEVYSSINLNLT